MRRNLEGLFPVLFLMLSTIPSFNFKVINKRKKFNNKGKLLAVFDGLNITESSWHGMFHAISAFQNAGFDITSGNSISIHRSNGFVVTTITLLSFLGATGFNALFALVIIRKWRPLNLDLKLVIFGSFIVALIGFLGILLSEWSNPLTFANMPLSQKLLDSFSLAIGCLLYTSPSPRDS